MVRQPAVAGQFYASDKEELRNTVKRYLVFPERKRPARGVMVPHAGYMYSGKTAGVVYGSVEFPPLVLMLGPNHTGLGAPVSVYAEGAWRTPLGEVGVDEALAAALLAACPEAEADTLAHQREHSLEVQVPFLQVLLPSLRMLPVVVGTPDFGDLKALGRAVAEVVRQSEEPVMILISSDMTHFESAESARAKDRYALDALESLDAEALHRVVQERRITMCGVAPATAALVALRELGARKGELLDYTNSGDVSGDYRSVVAYAGMVMA
jgi:AmmeMemoRadiSam system protein B